MSVQRKFMLTLTGLVLLAMLGSIVVISFSMYQEIESSVHTDKARLNREITNILTVTDALLSQQVQSSMKLLRKRIADRGPVSQGGAFVLWLATSAGFTLRFRSSGQQLPTG